MTLREQHYGVWLSETRVGHITQRGDYTRFSIDEEYVRNPYRPVLGLVFEQDLLKPHTSALRLPPWFSNLLPEGVLRTWVADDRGVSADREMELLAQVGHDLPGAVKVLPLTPEGEEIPWPEHVPEGTAVLRDLESSTGWRFSLAGVQLKFSMLDDRDRLTMPAFGEGGDWIVKLPDRQYPDVPRNEFAMMSLAAMAGIEVPEIKLVHRDQIEGLPSGVWPGVEEWAYAIRRFDRLEDGRGRIHIEDLAQVCNVYPNRKYSGNYESVASLIYRRRDLAGLREFTRRLAFIILISNGDAHLKNWSLIYRDTRIPALSPAYDLVSTAAYRIGEEPEDLGLKFGGSKRFDYVNVRTFERLEARLQAPPGSGLGEIVRDTVARTVEAWPNVADYIKGSPGLRVGIERSIRNRAQTLLGRS